jgi:hypothetical protein
MASDNQGFGILSTLQQGVQAMNRLITTLGSIFPISGGTTTTATGGAITPPAQVAGYIIVTLPDGSAAKVPYYT